MPKQGIIGEQYFPDLFGQRNPAARFHRSAGPVKSDTIQDAGSLKVSGVNERDKILELTACGPLYRLDINKIEIKRMVHAFLEQGRHGLFLFRR